MMLEKNNIDYLSNKEVIVKSGLSSFFNRRLNSLLDKKETLLKMFNQRLQDESLKKIRQEISFDNIKDEDNKF